MQVTKLCANGHHTLIFNINERIPENYIETNKTLVDWSIQLKADPSWAFYTIGSTIIANINNQEVYNEYAQRDCDGGSTVTWASGTIEIEHDSDGSKKIEFDCSYTQSSTLNWTPGNASLDGILLLTTIPRATNCPELNGDIESTYNIALNPASDDFTHSLKVVFGDIEKYINAQGALQDEEVKLSNKNINFTIPTSFYKEFTGKSSTGNLILSTYSENTKIAETQNTLTANCLESRCRPKITGTVVDSNSTTIGLTGDKNKLIKYYSKALISLDILSSTSSNDTNSTIEKQICDSKSFEGTTITLSKITKKDFSVTITNSRGFSATEVISATGDLIEYFEPTIVLEAYRTEQTGSTAKLNYSGKFFNNTFGSKSNDLIMNWFWKEVSDSQWTLGGAITPAFNSNEIVEATINCGDTFDYQTNYRFKIEATDKLKTFVVGDTVTAGVPIYSHGKNYFQHHTPLYLNSGNEVPDVGAMLKSTNGGTSGGIPHKQLINSGDFNELPSYGTGFFVMFGPCTNAPSGNGQKDTHWYAIQICYTSTYVVQILTNLHSASTIYQRIMTKNNWGAWYKIALST